MRGRKGETLQQLNPKTQPHTSQSSTSFIACLLYNFNLKGNMIHAQKNQIIHFDCINRLHICEPCNIYGFSTEYIHHAIALVCFFPHSLPQCDHIANEMTDDERTNPGLDSSSAFLLD